MRLVLWERKPPSGKTETVKRSSETHARVIDLLRQ